MLFSEAELAAVTPVGFFQDGIVKKVRIMAKEIVPNKSGEGSHAVFTLAEVSTGKEHKMTNFDFQDEVRPLNDKIELGVTVLEVTPIKKGEREYKGKMYDDFTFDVKIQEGVGF